ncbi:MAG: hypothetical protein ACRC33_16565 [Gemmataceae bacterium]
MRRVPFSVLRQLLLGLGFTVEVTPASLRFEDAATNTWFLFPPYADGDEVREVDFIVARKILDERGFMPRREVEERLTARPVAG